MLDNFMRFLYFQGGPGYRIIPLHSHLPREDQRKVFEPVPDDVTKVCFTIYKIIHAFKKLIVIH